MIARKGDLVVTEDGYYGIVINDDTVLLGNGLEQILDYEGMAELKVLPINPSRNQGAAANFIELVRAFYE